MTGSEVWVTVAEDDESCIDALALLESLRRCWTNRKVLTYVGLNVSKHNRKKLESHFDGVIKIGGSSKGDLVTAAKILCWSLHAPYRKCVFLHPRLLVLENCDELFNLEQATSEDTSILVLKPCLDTYEELTQLMQGNASESKFQNWIKSKSGFVQLGQEYNFPLVGNEGNALYDSPKIVNFGLQDNCLFYTRQPINDGKVSAFQKEAIVYCNYLQTCARRFLSENTQLEATLTPSYPNEPIAVVGLSFRFPGANNSEEFWDILVKGEDQMRPIPDHRWTEKDGLPASESARSIPGGYLKCAVDEFDARFFGMSPMELDYIDPQQRLALELTWEALEDACINPDTLRGTDTGIFTGTWKTDYFEMMTETRFRSGEFFRSYMGNAYGATSGRLSHVLGLSGSNVASESGCSSSIVALGLGCKSLRRFETDTAIVCGMNLLLHNSSFDTMKMVLSPDGHCKTFDADANGYARAEGVAVLILKRVSDAVRSNDRIYALLRGYGEAQEGLSKSMGTPTAQCEMKAMTQALRDAGVQPQEVSYVEAHGTGTPVGDPMEMEAVGKVYSHPERKEPLVVGSVKTIIGHTESCSGLAGVIKTILALQNDTIPPNINLKTINPKIDLASIPATIPLSPMTWNKGADGRRRIAGVSSYGLTGTDAHLILEEAPVLQKPIFVLTDQPSRTKEILLISSKSEDGLQAQIEAYKTFLRANPSVCLRDLCYSAAIGRSHFQYRAAVVGESIEEILKKLDKRQYIQGVANVRSSDSSSKAGWCFLFPGQGTQYHEMGHLLFDTCPTFRLYFLQCAEIFMDNYALDIREYMWGPEPNEELHRTFKSQAAIFSIEYALLKLWESWGIKPSCVLAHSFGEVCGSVASSALTLEQAARFTVERSQLVNGMKEGRMLALKAGFQKVQDMLQAMPQKDRGETFWIDTAAINAVDQVVICGRAETITDVAAYLNETHMLKTHILDAKQAFHSRDMEPILPSVENILKRLLPKDSSQIPRIDFISSVYGRLLEPGKEALSTDYWISQTRNTVRFFDASKAVYAEGYRKFLEVGSQPVLSPLVMRNNEGGERVTCFPSMRKKENEWTTLLNTLGQLYCMGEGIDWAEYYRFTPANKIKVPFYQFQRKRYWFPVPVKSENRLAGRELLHPLIGSAFLNPSSQKFFQNYVDLSSQGPNGYMFDHCLGKYAIFPGAGYLEMSLAAGHASTLAPFEPFTPPFGPIVVEQLKILNPLHIQQEDLNCHMQTVVEPSKGDEGEVGWSTIKLCSQQGGSDSRNWITHATARFSPVVAGPLEGTTAANLEEIKKRLCTSEGTSTEDFYTKLKKLGYCFGPKFQSLTRYWQDEKGEFLLETKVPVDSSGDKLLSHPVALDALIQSFLITAPESLQLPISIERFVWLGKPEKDNKDASTHANYIHVQKKKGVAELYDSNGKRLGMMSGVQFIQTSIEAVVKSLEKQKINIPLLFEDKWKELPLPPSTIPDSEQEGRTGRWVIFTTAHMTDGIDKVIISSFQKTGRRVGKVTNIDPTSRESIRSALTTIARDEFLEGIVYLLAYHHNKAMTPALYTQGYLHLEQVLLEEFVNKPERKTPKLFLLSKGAVYADLDEAPSHPPHPGALWGMSKTLRSEHPNVYCKCIDLDESILGSDEGRENLLREFFPNDKDYQVIYRDGVRYVARLNHLPSISLDPLRLPEGSERFALVLPTSKSINDLKFAPSLKISLSDNMIEVRVKAAGINFKDILNVMKPDSQFDGATNLGADFAGIVSRVGEKVTKIKVGAEVMGTNIYAGALPSHTCIWEEAVLPLPSHLTFEEGACFGTAFATVYHCLVTVANLKKGETILVHTASGAVGIVAVQLAQYIGATVIATAGSKAKRAFLSTVLGVKHVFNSRTLDFGEGVKGVTQGKGVHMVLNSLTSPGFKETSLACCRQNGSFVEMSKLNVWTPSEVKFLRPDAYYTIVDLSAESMEKWAFLMSKLHFFLSQKEMRPFPYTRFDAVHVRDALTYLQKAKHVGKVVCSMPEAGDDTQNKTKVFNDRSSYLITGGLGGIGLEVAKWMVDLGAKHIILCGRSSPTPKAQEVMDKLGSVTFMQADVGNRDECRALLERIKKSPGLPPLRGIMHAAGCLSDGLILDQSWDKFEATFNGKVVGGWNLHELTFSQDYNLEHFVVYSSIASILGLMGQSNHAAGNAFLDSLVSHRNALKLPATSVNWGQWGQVGIAAELEIPGISPFTPTQALTALELILKSHRLRTTVVEGDIGLLKLLFSWTTAYLQDVKVLRSGSSKGHGSSSTSSAQEPVELSSEKLWQDLETEKETEGRMNVVQKFITSVLSHILKLDETEDRPLDTNFQDLGLDSLMVVEFKNVMQAVLGPERVTLPLSAVVDNNTVGQLSGILMQLIYPAKHDLTTTEKQK